jgi:hypothetical protein
MSRIMPAALFADDAAMSDFASWTLALPAKVPVILQLGTIILSFRML